jgi:hypothetical protein
MKLIFAALLILTGIPREADLAVSQFRFDTGNPQGVHVRVFNYGDLNAPPTTFKITIRVINGITVSRTTDVALPVIPGGDGLWVFVDASSILPASVRLVDTTFRADADATAVIAEPNELNNRLWHNL